MYEISANSAFTLFAPSSYRRFIFPTFIIRTSLNRADNKS